MKMDVETELLQKSRKYVEEFLRDNLTKGIYYHDLEHTQEVVRAAEKIGRASNLTTDQLETVLIAAWFHDTGYYKGMKGHEINSKEVAESFLREEGTSEKKIEEVSGCILATMIPQKPNNIMEEVLCDADLHHVATKEFFKKSELLRKEFSLVFPDEIQLDEWFRNSIKFLKNHNFFTEYAKENLLPAKRENLKKLKVLYKDILVEDNDGDKTKKSKKKKEDKRPTRGIETLFRITSRNHVDFSSMADNKANIMISINSIMMSIVFSVLFNKFATDPNLIPPTIILSIVSTGTIIFAILATRPNLTAGVFTQEDIKKRRANLLFFGNFYKMPLNQYEWGVRELMNDKEFLYGSMIRDIYFLGKVLGKKYLYLRISYTIFMYGLVLSVIAFAVAVFLFPTTTI